MNENFLSSTDSQFPVDRSISAIKILVANLRATLQIGN